MRLRTLHRKLWRDLAHLRLQLLSIAAVMACALMTIAGLQSTIRTLERTRDAYFDTNRFADVFAILQRAPIEVGRRLAEVPGVGAVELRIVRDVKLDIPGLADPAIGHLVSIPETRQPMLNEPFVRTGRWITPGRPNEVLISERFASLNHLQPGDSIGAVLNGHWSRLYVVGTALSPEFVVEAAASPFGDSRRYANIWASRELVAGSFNMDGAFDDLLVRLAPGASTPAVIAAIDRALAPYGGSGAYPRKDQLGVIILRNEFAQLRTNAAVFSSFFLIVSAFLLNAVLSRLVSSQREQLAALKAFGYSNVEVGWHYVMYAFAAVLAGTILGIPAAWWMTRAFTGMYAPFFRFPALTPSLDWSSTVPAILVSGACALIGAVAAVRGAASMPPAQALRPETPGRMRPLLIESMGLAHLVSPAARLVFRNLERRPLRTLTSMIAIGLAIAILIAGRFPYDVFALVRYLQFGVASREDFAVQFTGARSARAAGELMRIAGVRQVEPYRATPVRLTTRKLTRTTVLTGYTPGATLHRLVDVNGGIYAVPPDGAVFPKGLATELGIAIGDTLTIDLLELGVRRPLIVSGVIDEMLGFGPYMDLRAMHRLMREDNAISGAYISVHAGATAKVSASFKHYPWIAGAASREATIHTFTDQTGQSTLLVMGLVIFSAAVIAIGVVYNNARIAVSERARELGSLRVLGYTQREITAMLVGEQALTTIAAIPLGLVFGLGFSLALSSTFQTPHYHFPFNLRPASQMFAVGVVLATTALGSVVIWRLVMQLDIVAALKTRE